MVSNTTHTYKLRALGYKVRISTNQFAEKMATISYFVTCAHLPEPSRSKGRSTEASKEFLSPGNTKHKWIKIPRSHLSSVDDICCQEMFFRQKGVAVSSIPTLSFLLPQP